MYIFDRIFPFIKKEFGKDVTIDSIDGKKEIKSVAYIKNKNLNSQSYFNDKLVYCEKEIKPGDIIKHNGTSYMCIRQIAKYKNCWVSSIRQCDFITKFVVGTEVKVTSSSYLSQNFKISESMNFVSSDSTVVCVIPDYVWTNNLIINQKFIQFGFRWTISGIDKTNKGLVYLHANREEKASKTENESGIPDGSEIYSTQVLWEEFPGYLEEGNKYQIEAKLYKQLPDLSWVPTLEKIVYRTDDTSIAYVDDNDLLNCVRSGKTRIYAEYLSDYSKSIYKDIEVNEVFINYEMDWVNSVSAMYTDDTYKFNAQVYKNDIPITVPILYEISDEYSDIAELGLNGNVTAKQPGTFIITATWNDNPNYKISKQVTVSESTYSVKFYNYSNQLKLNSSTNFNANVYRNGTIDATKTVRYSSDNLTSVQVDAETGVVNPVGLGKAKIKAYMVDNISVYDEVNTEVFEIVYSILWKKQITGMMYVGREYQIEAVVSVDFEPDITKKVGYRSSNDEIVTVDSEGNVTPVSVGSAELTAYYIDDESVKSTIVVNVSLNEYTLEWKDPEAVKNKFIAGGDYSNYPERIDIGVIVKRDGVDVTNEYKQSELYHWKTDEGYSAYSFNGQYLYNRSDLAFRRIKFTVSIPDIPNSPELSWEGATLPSATGTGIRSLIDGTFEFPSVTVPSGSIEILPDTSVKENGIVINQDTLLSTDILFFIGDLQSYIDGIDTGMTYYLFKYSDIFKEGELAQVIKQSKDAKYYKQPQKKEIPKYIKDFFAQYPDLVYPMVESVQPEVITVRNTEKSHYSYLRGNYLALTRVYQRINNYDGNKIYEYRSNVDVKQPNGLGIHMTFGKKLYTNQHNGIMAYATLNGERLDDNGMVFEIVDSNNTEITLRKFPKIAEGHFGVSGRPNVIESVLDTDDGWCEFSEEYKERELYMESGHYFNVDICPYPYNRQEIDGGNYGNDYFVNQSWSLVRDENKEIVFEPALRDVFVTEEISDSRTIRIKAYHKDYPNFSETREFTIYPYTFTNLSLYFEVRDGNSDELEYEGQKLFDIDIKNPYDIPPASYDPVWGLKFSHKYDYVTFYISDAKSQKEMPRYEDRYDYGFWHIDILKGMHALESARPNIRRNIGTTSYPRQTVVHLNDWDSILDIEIRVLVQPASLLVDSSRYSSETTKRWGNREDALAEIEYFNNFPKVLNGGIQENPSDAYKYSVTFRNLPHPYETHVVNDSIWIDKNYDRLTNFANIYGTQYPDTPYENGDYENVILKGYSCSRHQYRLYDRNMTKRFKLMI